VSSGEVQDPDKELRHYWSPKTRGVIYAFIALGAAVVAIAFGSVHHVDVIGWIVLAVCPVVVAHVLLNVHAAGVRETPTALTWRNGIRGERRFTGQVAWADVRAFGYAAAPVTQTLVVTVADGSRTVVWGGRHTMRWHGGETNDFAQLMTERARKFGAPIDPCSAQEPT